MTTPAYIWHVALGIGQGTRETRAHLSDADIALYGAHLERALAVPGGDPIPDHADYALAAQAIAGVLLCTIGHRSSMDALCTFCVVTKSRHRVKAWEALHQGYPEFEESRGDVPQAPYCAVRSEWGLLNHTDAGAWLDAYQVAVAWAWIEGKRE